MQIWALPLLIPAIVCSLTVQLRSRNVGKTLPYRRVTGHRPVPQTGSTKIAGHSERLGGVAR